MRTFIITLSCLALVGCMVGPNFRSPSAPEVKRFTQLPLPPKTSGFNQTKGFGKAQHFAIARDIPGDWWTIFHSKPLNALVCAGIENNPNLQAAKAALTQAQEIRRAQLGLLFFPQIDGQFCAARNRATGTSVGFAGPNASSSPVVSVFDSFSTSANVSYLLDVFGGSRRQLEAYSAQVDYQQYQVEAAYLSLTSNIVLTVIAIASYESQIEATQAIIRSQVAQLNITKKQFNLGSASQTDVLTQESQVAQSRALLPPLQLSLAKSRDALAALTGRFPCELYLPKLKLIHLTLPKNLPLSLPSQLVQQRPDIRAQEALVHQTSANIGVATANLLPQIRLTGDFSWKGTTLGHLFRPQNVVWNYGASLLQPIFHGGELIAQRRAAIADFEQSAALYRQTVLQAFQNVSDTLEAIKNDADAYSAQKRAEQSAYKTLAITQKQYQLGGVSYLSLLNAQRQYQQTNINRIQAEAARLADTAALFQALGGGWWNRDVSISYRRFTR